MSPRGTVRNQAMRDDAVALITGAAARSFAELGFHGATMKGIAAGAGLSYGLVYHYFPSKEAVFRHLVEGALEGTIAGMHAVLEAPGTAWEKLERYSAMLASNAFSGESARYFLIMVQALTQANSLGGLAGHIFKRTGEFYDVLVPLVARAQADGTAAPGDPVLLVAAYLSFVQGLALLVHQGRGLEKQIDAELLLRVLRGGGA